MGRPAVLCPSPPLSFFFAGKLFGKRSATEECAPHPNKRRRWPVPLLETLLPRHMQIIYEINHRFLLEVAARWPGDTQRLRRMSIIEESSPKLVRMAHLAMVGSHAVNGVAQIHTRLLRCSLFPDFADLWPGKFSNKTNGVTPRRWLLGANRPLSDLLTKQLGSDRWVLDAAALQGLAAFASDPIFQAQWQVREMEGPLGPRLT